MRLQLLGSALALTIVTNALRAEPPLSLPPAAHPMPTAAGATCKPDWSECAGGCACCPEGCRDRFWVDAEFLLFWFKRSPQPTPLVTSASFMDAIPGALGQPNTRVLVGGSSVDEDPHYGARFTAGCWLDPAAEFGVEANYLFLAQQDARQTISTSGLPGSANAAVPFFDVSGTAGRGGVPGETIFVLPGPFPGFMVGAPTAQVPGFQGVFQRVVSSRLQGAEGSGTWRIMQGDGLRLDGVAGFRWLQLKEDLTFAGQTAGVPGSLFDGQYYNVFDHFGTTNNFYGGQLGLRARYDWQRFSLQGSAKVALGDMHESANVQGASATSSGNLFVSTGPTAPHFLPGGIFTQPSNLGRYDRDCFAVVPEFKIDLCYRVTQRARLFVGYTFLYASEVARPGDQIDRNINLTRTSLADASRGVLGAGPGPIPFGRPGAAPAPFSPGAPSFNFNGSSFWAQGIDFGLDFQF